MRSLSFWDIFLFDLRPARDEDDERIANERIRGLTNVGPYLVASHFICALVIFVYAWRKPAEVVFLGTLLPLIGVLVLAALLTLLDRKGTRNFRPHQVVRLWGWSTLSIGALWSAVIAFGLARSGDQLPVNVYAALLGAFCLTVVGFVSVPTLLVISYVVALCGFLLFSVSNELLGLLIAFGGCLVAASTFGARGALIAAGRQLQNEYLAKKASRFVAEFEASGRGWFWETDANGSLTYVSAEFAQELQRNPDDLLAVGLTSLLESGLDAESQGQESTLGFHLSARVQFSDLITRVRQTESVFWSLSGTPHFDAYGRFLGFSGIGSDLTERRLAEAEINRLARFDALTGLPNRTVIKGTLEEAIAGIAKQKKGCAILLIDLDRFKNVNDTLGHPIGDQLLKHVTRRLLEVVGEYGQVARIGGDEFQAVFPATDSDVWLGQIAARIIEQVSQPYLIDDHNISIGASIGIAIARTSHQCADALIRDADLALYAAKDGGRGTFRIFAPDMHSNAKDRQQLEHDLRGAIGRGELRLVYQPVVNAVSEQLVAFEALVRWVHPERGPQPTDRFIALAEECGLIGAIGEWVLRTACEEAAQWPNQVRIAVNISPIQFENPKFVEAVLQTLSVSGLEPDRLELEITEGVFLSHEAGIDETFKRLKAMGIRLALDDFGTGYSSLSYLKRAPLDKIKIDQSFVRGAAATGSSSEAILRSIISLALSLKMDTTAEGVETHDDLRLIRELGCTQIQGYIFGAPKEADEARALALEVETIAASGYENARPPRYGMIRKAEAQWNGMSFPVRIRNISAGGAMIDSTRSVPVGGQVQLDLPGCGNLGAEVRWTSDNQIGLRFDRAFNLRQLAPKTQKGEAVGFTPTYLSTEQNADSPWASRKERLSPTDLKKSSG